MTHTQNNKVDSIIDVLSYAMVQLDSLLNEGLEVDERMAIEENLNNIKNVSGNLYKLIDE